MRAPGNAAAEAFRFIKSNTSRLYPQNTVVVDIDTAAAPVGRGGSLVPFNGRSGNLPIAATPVARFAVPVTSGKNTATLVLGSSVFQNGTTRHGETTPVINENATACLSGVAGNGSTPKFE